MSIAYEDVFDVLAEAVTDFKPTESELEDRLSYPFLWSLVRFICDRASLESEVPLREFADLIERLISEGDSNVQDLAHDALETLWEYNERDLVSGYFGPKPRELWDRICAGERGQ